ncbi:MAG: hypothetical protein ACI9UK_001257 [Candidatus Krumholzibacteriia bacterium]|jgi:hypothetical protein
MTPATRICLWSGPRNISTALMYSFAQRADTTVYDEPLYAHYLTRTPARDYHPGAEKVIAELENDGNTVIEKLILGKQPTPVAFFKHMTHHLVDLDWTFMDKTVNVILTRDPVDMLPSFAENIEQPTLTDVGYAKHVEVLEYLQERGQTPVVLDSRQVLLDPRQVLEKLCEQVGISFDEAVLSWPAGARPEDGCWAEHWYASVHKSTAFAPYKAKKSPFPDHLKPLLAQCKPLYAQLSELAIRA